MKRILSVVIGMMVAAGTLCACAPAAETPAVLPVEAVSSADEMSEKLGFTMETLSMDGYEAARFEILDGELGQITYENQDGRILRLRVQDVSDDICGIEGAKDAGMHKIGKHDIWLGYLDGTQIAQWGDNGFTYCLIGENFGGLGRKPFKEAVAALEKQIEARRE